MKTIGSGALAAILAAFVGGAFAASGPAMERASSISGGDVYQSDAPDCKAKPTDPRCKDQKK